MEVEIGNVELCASAFSNQDKAEYKVAEYNSSRVVHKLSSKQQVKMVRRE